MKKVSYQRYEHAAMSLPDRAFPHRVTEGVWLWSTYEETRALDCNGYLIQTPGQQAFIVDPPCAGPEVLDAFLALPTPHSVIVTSARHQRASQRFREAFGLPVFAPEGEAALLETPPDHVYRAGTVFPNGWQAIALQDQQAPGECALYHAELRMLMVGDALIGHPFQRLSVSWLSQEEAPASAALYTRCRNALQGLQPLRGLEVDVVLPAHGDPVLRRGSGLVEEALLEAGRALMALEDPTGFSG
ncbi:MBL fold metallo-hydrolase [Vampirovibrio chlorellavorus]|uniref:MBL fold metallo-hydrolase n=1 Tax=Vampirovibrio chlorellavorus TaxID=758823 RepID=UPI0026EF3139|nr:MBL fold metallo-hydrolase [Vampirovibrio chlorellavorus]